MNYFKILTIGLIAALSLVVTPAWAAESNDSGTTHDSTEAKPGLEREIAAESIKAAAAEAARSLLRETRLDLDIRLIGPTSPRIAGRK